MTLNTQSSNKPAIVLADTDHRRLSMLARASSISEDILDGLMIELDRAQIVPHEALPQNTIAIGSSATFVTSQGRTTDVTLVMPAEADIAQGKISILTPIGVALLGLTEGQTIEWQTRNDQTEQLTVKSVNRNIPDGDDDNDGPTAA